MNIDRGPIGGIAISADGRRVLTTNYGDDTVSIIDAATGEVVNTVFGADEPFAIVTGAASGRAYVGTANAAFDALLAIDIETAEVVASCPVAMGVGDLAVDPTCRRVYVARTGDLGVDVLAVDASAGPTDAVDVSTTLGSAAVCLRTGPAGRRVYVAVHTPDGDTITVLDADLNILDTIEIGSTIIDVAVHPDGTALLVATYDADGAAVHAVDARTHAVTGSIAVDAPLIQLIVSRDGDRAYLITAAGVLVICPRTHEVLGTLTATTAPSCAVESPDGSRLYIAGFDGAVTVASVADLPAPSAALHDQLALDDAVTRMLELQPAV
ncbi:YncE family protein [Mycolicibacter acidiphilus]|uniref:YncE family protein n=1 Tax=Mycolicibacter acidiphilus TaxID=2835306 RepID=UPI0027DAB603|nr:YncE family protein [Mycolicibacter acidiphilus]